MARAVRRSLASEGAIRRRSTLKAFGVLAASAGASFAAAPVFAADYLAHPDGSGEDCTRALPCALGTAAMRAVAGDTVILMDGGYHQGLYPKNSGTADAWITFRADQCAVPILEGDGEQAMMDAEGYYPSGVFMSQATYLRFIGIVS